MRYRETQKFNGKGMWLYVLLTGTICSALLVWSVWQGIVGVVLCVIAILGFLMLLFYLALLEIQLIITEENLELRKFPSGLLRVYPADVSEAVVRERGKVGVYGIPASPPPKPAPGRTVNYLLDGSHYLDLRLTNGDRYRIGTNQPEALREFMAGWLEGSEERLELAKIRRRQIRENLL